MSDAPDRVRAALQQMGVRASILEFPQGTRTATQAAAAVGTTVAQIVKSLLFVADGRPVLALVSGANRLDEGKLARAAGAGVVRKAAADLVREVTGFAIGGVPPVGHARPLPAYIDRDLLQFDVVYAAAGTPHAVFPISPADLVRVTGGVVADLRADETGPL
ncbi:MAG: YbaK/EbsC family protein [Armatimonadota bacterium]|nr:YbaK/EbsC family protein [Armatimonadota bacterium]MDR7401775.1 YbaK/EbsC family protein [Armatimonadota bacterium]MDR7403077.1 YbaK/EbsC family protein [Armatimonadota bacterium]MDR7436220.1 YbaK/EbsC family protein [Armatimonadota bacterium]MDR7471399.1 YbaK/EbsC family protein [Armatimonadota bacterium]